MIKKGDLKIGENEKNIISKLENIKVFISITDLYDEKFKIKKIIVNKANFYLNSLSLKNFILNLKKNIVNNFIIKKNTLFFKNKNDEIILITGSGGSIGGELCLQLAKLKPKKIVLLDISEYGLYQIERKLLNYLNPCEIILQLGIKNVDAVTTVKIITYLIS